MLRSESIDRLILEYDNLLVRDLGFSDWENWMPMISEVMDTLGVVSLKGMSLEKAQRDPGKDIVLFLIQRWTSGKGKYWDNLVYLEESKEVTPYDDYLRYTIKIKSEGMFLTELTGSEVYSSYETIKNIFKSQDYQTLYKLDGVYIEIKQ